MTVKRNSLDFKPLCKRVQLLIESKIDSFTATDKKTAWELADIHFKHTVLAAYFFPLFDDEIEQVEYILELSAMSENDRKEVGMFTNVGWLKWHIGTIQHDVEWVSYAWLSKCAFNYIKWKLTGELSHGEIIEWEPDHA